VEFLEEGMKLELDTLQQEMDTLKEETSVYLEQIKEKEKALQVRRGDKRGNGECA
jgi:uncharacterized protein YfbU (UPF0304 family)